LVVPSRFSVPTLAAAAGVAVNTAAARATAAVIEAKRNGFVAIFALQNET
jgi:hypothetical protein